MSATYNTSKAQPWIVCLVAALFFFYEFVQMSMFNAINPELIRDFSVSSTQLGSLAAAYFYANILFVFPAGLIVDRFSTKKIILSAMVLCVAGTMLFSMTHTLRTAMFCRFLTGIGGSFPFLCCLRLAVRWFPPYKMASITGFMVTMAMLGGMFAQTPLTLLVQSYGWRGAVFIDSLLGIFFIFLIIIFVKDAPYGYTQQAKVKPEKTPLIFSIKTIVRNSQNWFYGLYTCMLNLPIFLIAQTWGSLYLIQIHHLSATQASYLTSMVFLGTIIGSPFIGWFSDMIQNRKLPMYGGAILSLIVILLIAANPHMSFDFLVILFFALGLFTSTQILSYPAITALNQPALVGGALGLSSIFIMGGGAVFEPLFGWLMGWHWDHTMINHTPIYSAHNYLLALSIMPIAFIIGIVMTILAKEPNAKAKPIDSTN